jgi:hypothetical protein
MEALINNLWWLIPTVIVVGSAALGFGDLIRLSWTRIWAISGVCFQESIRRRVLWVIPLAIVGVLAVSAFQKAVDQQDAIRQIIQFSLFATGMLLVLTLIILACTNLPREIENRVIFTIVTKPTSRLEIVLGKVVGFSRISALVLAIMGLFTLSYVGVQSVRMHAAIDERLKQADLPPGERISLEYYQQFGLLSAKRLVRPVSNDVLAELPAGPDAPRWIGDSQDGDVLIPFAFDPANLDPIVNAADNDANQPVLVIRLHALERPAPSAAATHPSTQPSVSPFIGISPTSVTVQLLRFSGDPISDASSLGGTLRIPANGAPLDITVPRQVVVQQLASSGRFQVAVTGASKDRQIGFANDAAELLVLSSDHKIVHAKIDGLKDTLHSGRQYVRFRGHQGRGGQQVRGAADRAPGTLALLEYRNTGFPADQGPVSLEIRTAVERSTSDSDDSVDLTKLELTVINRDRPDAAPVVLTCFPENSRTFFVSIPGQAVAGGNFDIVARSSSAGNWFSAETPNFSLVASTQPFIWNLAKSLFVMWLMSLLVIIAAVFTSTFVSWPIAVVLTLLILLGRWGVNQLGDTLDPGIGNQISTSFGFKDVGVATTVSKSVEALSSLLRGLGAVLPDISNFAASEDIQRGMQLQPAILANSGITLLLFGLPMLALAYVFLRYKEVAP